MITENRARIRVTFRKSEKNASLIDERLNKIDSGGTFICFYVIKASRARVDCHMSCISNVKIMIALIKREIHVYFLMILL